MFRYTDLFLLKDNDSHMSDTHQARTVRILIASPSDVEAEREIAEWVSYMTKMIPVFFLICLCFFKK